MCVLGAAVRRKGLAALFIVAHAVADAARKARVRRKGLAIFLVVAELVAVGALHARHGLLLKRGARLVAHRRVRIHVIDAERRRRHAERQLIQKRDGESARVALRAAVDIEARIVLIASLAADGTRARRTAEVVARIPIAAFVLLEDLAAGRALAVERHRWLLGQDTRLVPVERGHCVRLCLLTLY